MPPSQGRGPQHIIFLTDQMTLGKCISVVKGHTGQRREVRRQVSKQARMSDKKIRNTSYHKRHASQSDRPKRKVCTLTRGIPQEPRFARRRKRRKTRQEDHRVDVREQFHVLQLHGARARTSEFSVATLLLARWCSSHRASTLLRCGACISANRRASSRRGRCTS